MKLPELEPVLTERDFEMERLDHPPKLSHRVVELYNYLSTAGGLWRADARPTNGAHERFDDANVPPFVARSGS